VGGPKGKKNGELLKAAEPAGSEVLISSDKGMTHQHNFGGQKDLGSHDSLPDEST